MMAPDITGKSFFIEAEVIKKDAALSGVLFAWGSWFGGLVLYIQGGSIVLEYAYSHDEHVKVIVDEQLPVGRSKIAASFDRDSSGGLNLTLSGSGLRSAHGHTSKAWPNQGPTAGISCGHDAGHPVSDAYVGPFPFSGGDLIHVTVTVGARATAGGGDVQISPFLED